MTKIPFLLLFIHITMAAPLLAEPGSVTLSTAFNGSPVLQRGMPTAIWGTSSGVSQLRLELQDSSGNTLAAGQASLGTNPNWRISLTIPGTVAGVRSLKIFGDGALLLTRAVLVGEVWLCSGQSNMAWPAANTDVVATTDPLLRVLRIPLVSALEKQESLPPGVQWRFEAELNKQASAVCLAMGQKLRQELNVPIGLISAAKGATLIEEWMDRESLRNFALENAGNPIVYGRWFNSMIYPLRGYAIRGIAWYQGEHNSSSEPVNSRTVRATRYLSLLPALFANWRALWKQAGASDTAAALVFQLGASGCPQSGNVRFSELREAQRLATAVIANSRLVPVFDTADFNPDASCSSGYSANIHSKYKKIAGERGAALALGAFYEKPGFPKQSPVLQNMHIVDGSVALLTFGDTGTISVNPEFSEKSVEVCCDLNGKFKFAESIAVDSNGRTLKVTAPSSVSSIQSIRYAWDNVALSAYTLLPPNVPASFAANYKQAGLTDQYGLPIAPFSTLYQWSGRGGVASFPLQELRPLLGYTQNNRRLRGWACYARSPFAARIAVVSKDRSEVLFVALANLPPVVERSPICDSEGGGPDHDFDVMLPPAAERALSDGSAEVIVEPFNGYGAPLDLSLFR